MTLGKRMWIGSMEFDVDGRGSRWELLQHACSSGCVHVSELTVFDDKTLCIYRCLRTW